VPGQVLPIKPCTPSGLLSYATEQDCLHPVPACTNRATVSPPTPPPPPIPQDNCRWTGLQDLHKLPLCCSTPATSCTHKRWHCAHTFSQLRQTWEHTHCTASRKLHKLPAGMVVGCCELHSLQLTVKLHPLRDQGTEIHEHQPTLFPRQPEAVTLCTLRHAWQPRATLVMGDTRCHTDIYSTQGRLKPWEPVSVMHFSNSRLVPSQISVPPVCRLAHTCRRLRACALWRTARRGRHSI
jgi:hypothetical protein